MLRHIENTLLLLFLLCPLPLTAQMRDGSYQALKTGRENTVETVTVNVIPLGNGVMHFHEGDPRRPLNGSYRINVNRREYRRGSFKKGIVDGEWECYYEDYLKEKSFYRNGRPDGKQIRYSPDGREESVYTYRNGIRQHYVSYHPDGSVYEEQFYDTKGKLHGEMFVYDANGNIKEERRYQHGRCHGKQVKTDKEGYRTSEEYVDNRRQGAYSKRYPGGGLQEQGAYDENEKKTGKWTYRNEDGSLKTEEHYRDDKLHGERRVYYAGENLKSTEEYFAGRLHGPKSEYDETPHRLSRELTYSDGDLHGTFKVWHDGILWREGAYQHGELIYEKEYADGKLQIVKLLDENGALIPVEKYDNAGRRTYRNPDHRTHRSVSLKESPAGVIDVEIR